MMKELPVMETRNIRASIVVIRSVAIELNVGLTIVSLVTFSNAMFCCVMKSVEIFFLNIVSTA